MIGCLAGFCQRESKPCRAGGTGCGVGDAGRVARGDCGGTDLAKPQH